jgi:hypothetical protein
MAAWHSTFRVAPCWPRPTTPLTRAAAPSAAPPPCRAKNNALKGKKNKRDPLKTAAVASAGATAAVAADGAVCSVHAEVMTYYRVPKRVRHRGVILLVVRVSRDHRMPDRLRLSKPCSACQRFISKRRKRLSVIYSTD